MTVADASVLIALAKIGRLELLRSLFGRVWIAPAVKAEALDAGIEKAALEVGLIQAAIEGRWLRVARLSAREKAFAQRLMEAMDLDAGEAESVALARSRRLLLVVDDLEGRSVARTLGLDFVGTAGVVFQAFAASKLSFEDFEQELRKLARATWLSGEVIAELLRRARRLRA